MHITCEMGQTDNSDVPGDGERKCFMCGRPAGLVCKKCNEFWFCCEEHGRLHFREEEGVCFPWKVETREGVGRIMTTTRKVAAGETIFMEEPMVHGPCQEGQPVCLVCYEFITQDQLCPGCGYPVCDAQCAREHQEQHAGECAALARAGKPVFKDGVTDGYHCILPLRMILLARSHPNIFNLGDHLMDHEEERRGSQDWLITEQTVVAALMKNNDEEDLKSLTVAEIRRAVGVLEVNSYEVNDGLRGCFPIGSLMSHSCVPNCGHIWTHTAPFTKTCFAAVDLEAGQEVLTTYQIPTTATLTRRSNLKAGWYFDCACERCSSSSELGTNINTLVCPRCNQAKLRPESPLLFGSIWRCSACGKEVTETFVKDIVENIINDTNDIINNERHNVHKWLELETSSLRLVHPQHQVMLEITKWLVPVMCRGPNQVTSDFPISLVQRKLQLAQSYLSVLDVVEPGFTKIRAKVLYEILETELFLMFQDNPGTEELQRNLTKHMTDLRLVVKILEKLCPHEGFETLLVQSSLHILERIEVVLTQLGRNSLNLEDWRQGWSLVEVLRGG